MGCCWRGNGGFGCWFMYWDHRRRNDVLSTVDDDLSSRWMVIYISAGSKGRGTWPRPLCACHKHKLSAHRAPSNASFRLAGTDPISDAEKGREPVLQPNV